ncbi:MAG: hypothetical protein IJV76_07480 [Clostridia bacterium]|nr:hypothetical protein [Clostridia bacterium]
MYYSKHHKGLFFINRGMGNLEFRGEGGIYASDTEIWNPDGENWKDSFTTVTVYDDITEIYEGVLEQFRNVHRLNLPKSLIHIDSTEELRTLLHTNDVIVHAPYGSYGDKFAAEMGLRFWPMNIELGWYKNEAYDESTRLVLCFREDGSMNLLYDIFTTGISAGSSGGASLWREMPNEYYPGCSSEQFAGMFPAPYYEHIINNPEVKEFLRRDARRNKQDKDKQKEDTE